MGCGFCLGAGIWLRSFGLGQADYIVCPCSKGGAVCSSAFMGRDCAEENDFARKPATGFAARGEVWNMTKRQAFEIAGRAVLEGTRRTVNLIPKVYSELEEHLYYRQNEVLVC